MKDVSELAKSRYKAGVESDHPEKSAQRAEIVMTRILIDGQHAVGQHRDSTGRNLVPQVLDFGDNQQNLFWI